MEFTGITNLLCASRCQLDELGWSKEGRSLGFPQRPAWKGVVSNGEELNILEEETFSEWKKSTHDRCSKKKLSQQQQVPKANSILTAVGVSEITCSICFTDLR